MLYRIIERFRPGRAPEVYRRVRDRGRLAPEGLRYVASWVDLDFERCFHVMEADEATLLEPWMANWSDLVDFEVVPVRSSAAAAAIAAQLRGRGTSHGSELGKRSAASLRRWLAITGCLERLGRAAMALGRSTCDT